MPKHWNNNWPSYVDPDGRIAWFVPVIIGAVVGAYSGASIQSSNWNPMEWKNDWWKGAVVGGIIGAGTGGLVSWGGGASGTISGSVAAGWKVGSSALIHGNVNIASKYIQGAGLEGAWKAGLIGLGSGAIGAYAHLQFADKIPQNNFLTFLEKEGMLYENALQNGFGQIVSGTINGSIDRLISSTQNGVKGWNLALNTVIGGFEGIVGGLTTAYTPNLTGLKDAVSAGITSVPGLGLRIARGYLTINGLNSAYGIYSGDILGKAAGLKKILSLVGILGTESALGAFKIKNWLKKINYPDPIWD